MANSRSFLTMHVPFKKTVAYTLIALLAIISGVGEGLHWIPGCGHATQVGNTLLLFGVDLAEIDRVADGHLGIRGPKGPKVPVCDEDECPVCSMVGHSFTTGEPISHLLGDSLVQEYLPPISLSIISTRPRLFHARAPPAT